ncbi:MAG: branched-chain amino acid ABC transporter permease [Nitrospiraceae bacterium]|nr:MAG: branched-chain amino acid ABC transporter permease [Nitrospiraceae bacterium]
MKKFLFMFWCAVLALPFMGVKGAAYLLGGILVSYGLYFLLVNAFGRIKMPVIPLNTKLFTIALIAVALTLPLFMKDYYTDVAILAGIYMILALGVNIIVGFSGLLHLGFAAFYGLGAYSNALLTTSLGLGFWSALACTLVFTSAAGFLLAFPALRLRGDYLAIVTLGFGEIIRLVLNNWDSLTHGPNGISNIPSPFLAGFELSSLTHYYYLVFCFVMIAAFIVKRVQHSRTGRAWLSIREDETAAEAMGINTRKYKFMALSFGAFWAGLAGALFASKMHFVSPESFSFMESVFIVCMIILGGIGSIPGVILGSLILVLLPEMLREVQLYRMLALGIGLVLMMIFRPQGLISKRVES